MRLQIEQQFARIGLNIQEPVLDLHTTLPTVELNPKLPRVRAESPAPVIHIDQSECFADEGRRNLLDFALYCSEQAKADFAVGLKQQVEQGDILGDIPNGIKYPQLVYNSLGQTGDFNVSAIPQHAPRIWFDLYPVQTQYTPGSVNLQVHRGAVENNSRLGYVEVYLAQKNYLKINCIDNQVDMVA